MMADPATRHPLFPATKMASRDGFALFVEPRGRKAQISWSSGAIPGMHYHRRERAQSI
jgi:hypothetical protein